MGLRQQAILDAKSIVEDSAGFGWPVTLISPLGAVSSLTGLTTDVGQIIDPDTGQAVTGRRASVTLARASLVELPEAVADASRRPWVVRFADSQGTLASFKVIEVLPDRAVGLVVLILESIQLGTVRLAGGLTLPGLRLTGEYDLHGAMSGDLQLPPGPDLAGGLTVEVSMAGALALPEVELAGGLAVEVSMAGALALPALALAGGLTVQVSMAPAALTLPALTLTGGLTVGPVPMTAWLDFETATTVAGAYSSVPDLLSSNPATQTTAARRPAVSASPNGRPIAIYSGSGPTSLSWPINAGNFSTGKLGFAGWFRWPTNDALAAILEVSNGTGGASVRAFELSFAASGVRPQLVIFDSGGGVKQWQGPLSSLPLATRFFFRSFYDSSGATDADKCQMWINESPLVLTPTGGGTGLLRSATGNIILSNFNNSAANSSGFNGEQGPILWAYQQPLTVAQGLALMNYRAPN